MGESKQVVPVPRFRLLRLLAVALSFCLSVACADILGIDPPSGPSGAGAGGNGAAGEIGNAAGTAAAGENEGGEAGAAGSGGHPTLYIDGPDETPVCPGVDAVVRLEAKGGTPPYRWRIVGPNLGFKLSAPDPNDTHATLSGPSVTASLQVQVTDAVSPVTGFVRAFSVSVPSVPVITLTSVPSVCPNELYSVELTAKGGDPTTYKWSSPDLPSSLGVSVKDNFLKGKFLGAANGDTHADFTLLVQDSGTCPAQPVSLSLTFEAATASVCPEVRVEGQLAGSPPPPPCLGNAYDEKLSMLRGRGAFQWFVDSVPPGLSFDPISREVTGVSTGPGTLTTHATDTITKRTIETSFLLQPREKCWLAYLAAQADTQRLNFFDALLSDGAGGIGRTKTFGTGRINDFKFSPNGKYVAYRAGQAGGPLALSIVKLGTWQESPRILTDVTRYEWSPDSTALAIAYNAIGGATAQDPTATLAWVDVAYPAAGPPGVGLAVQIFSEPASVDSDAVWFDQNHLAFLSSFPGGLFLAYSVSVGAEGFEPPTPYPGFYFPGDTFRPAAHGVFVFANVLSAIYFFGSDGSAGVPHGDEMIGPSGRYLARTEQQALFLFRATDPSAGNATPRAMQVGCDSILAWAAGTERIACAHQTSATQAELTFFDIDPNTDALSLVTRLPLREPSSALLGRHRLFSPNGGLFAYTTDTSLSVATLTGSGAPSAMQVALDPNSTNTLSELVFSPSVDRLLLHRGSQLSFFDLLEPTLEEIRFDDLVLLPSLPCTETFNDVSAGFCGTERPASTVEWAPSSDLAVFQSAAGSLEVEDFTRQRQSIFQKIHVNPSCGQGCVVSGQFGFQP